jgi:N-sulfoglucosamine sulfohydrolase
MQPSLQRDLFRLAGAALLLACSGSAGAAERDPRPNILFCLADDWMWPHAGAAGDTVVQTPAFDRVAREGVLFRNAFAAAPSCTASRGAILTGQWHWRLEQGVNLYGTLPAKFDVYPDLLETAGYQVGCTRKGWAPGGVKDGGRTRNPAGPSFKDFPTFLAARPQGRPFCFWFGSTDPHRPYTWESGVQSGLKPEAVTVPPYLPDCETVRQDICDYYWKVQRFDREVGDLLSLLEKAGELDNTLVVITGDNGWPFPRCKATLYETGTHQPLAIRWPARFAGGRVVDDFVSLSDVAPTFLAAAGLTPPAAMTGRSLLPVLLSGKAGRVDPQRDHVLTGMERHAWGRPRADGGFDGYPMRAWRQQDFHYIRNFQPDRWPACNPNGVGVAGAPPHSYEQLASNTFAAFADVDSSPSKAWMVLHRGEPAVQPLFARAFGKRPERELYDLKKDPYQLQNVAADLAYADVVQRLDAQLLAELKATGDPRATGGGEQFDAYPLYGVNVNRKPNAK